MNYSQLQPPPEFFDHRIKMFDELKAEYDAFVAG
jgi:threonyl-tRNA synthetase